MDYVRRFDDIRACDAGAFGENAANLGGMRRAGLPVPPGFCLSAEAYRAFLVDRNVDKTIAHILAGLQLGDPEDVEVRTEQVRNFLNRQQMPACIAQEVLQGYYELSVDLGSSVAPVPVALRSSSAARDMAGCTCSGLPEAHLNVIGEAHLLEHVKRCWGALWTARSVVHRVNEGIDHARDGVAVIVQAMIQADASGYLFAANPLTASRDEAVIVACWGLSEAITSGMVTPDTFLVRRSDGAIVTRNLAAKGRLVECAREGGTIERELATDRRRLPALSEAQIAELVGLSRALEKIHAAPQDIEWAYARGSVHVLQALNGWPDLPYRRFHLLRSDSSYDCRLEIEFGLSGLSTGGRN